MQKKTAYSIITVIALIAALAALVIVTGCASDGDAANSSGAHTSCH
jgi:hypothetical protein